MKYIILFLAIIISGPCFSQIQVSFSTGLAGFDMREMKKHQSELQTQFPVDVKTVESFPPFWYYELGVIGSVARRFRVGGMAGYTSTGGRMHYKDYSGEITCEQLTTAWIVGGQGEMLLTQNEKFPIYVSFKTGIIAGQYDLNVDGELDSEHLKFRANNLFIEPGFTMAKRIYRILAVNLNAGYNVNVSKGKLRLKDDKDAYLLNDSGDEVRVNWSGFRVNAGISVVF